VNRVFRTGLLVMLLAALPMRAFAGAWMVPCDAHHGGATAAHEHVHETGDAGHGDSGADGEMPAQIASTCSLCSTCSAGASLAPEAPLAALPEAAGSDRIIFFDRRSSGFVPGNLDRPPLAS